MKSPIRGTFNPWRLGLSWLVVYRIWDLIGIYVTRLEKHGKMVINDDLMMVNDG